MPVILDAELTIDVALTIDGEMQEDILVDGEQGLIQYYSNYQSYGGATTVTPTEQQQVLNTNGLLMQSNITVQPIPTNYGKITWDGTKITVT